jgi:hypothetical protein
MGHFTRRPKFVYIADSSIKYFAAREQRKGNLLLHFHDNNKHLLLLTATFRPTIQRGVLLRFHQTIVT